MEGAGGEAEPEGGTGRPGSGRERGEAREASVPGVPALFAGRKGLEGQITQVLHFVVVKRKGPQERPVASRKRENVLM